ncbi:hypothetical protein C8R43DRAFT_188366 [Mycena crocata]|nr:hypothetical protein C8R43DRAFT_188366 [Mycena crocata]
MSRSDNLPQELIDIIVDDLYNDIPTLKACSLAARTFVSPTRTHLFKRIEITPPPGPGNGYGSCHKFHQLLTSSPHIASLVRELCIVLVGSETSFEYDEDGQYLEERRATWIMTGRTLSLILPLLDLKRISLVENSPVDWNGVGDYSMNWTKLGRKLKSTLTDVFSSSKLESVHLRGIVMHSPTQLLSLFSEATSLKEMSLSRVYFTQRWDQREPWPESEPWRPQLQSLLVSDINGDYLSPYLLHPQINLSGVRSLAALSSQWEKITAAFNPGAVEHLRLWGANVEQSRLDHLMASGLGANLRSLYIFVGVPFRIVAGLFLACSRAMRLEYITFECNRTTTPSEAQNSAIEASLPQFPVLKTVEWKAYTINHWSPSVPSFSDWSVEVRAALPSLANRGMLRLMQIQCAWLT